MRIVDVLIAATLAKPETNTLAKIAQACRELPGGKTFHPSRLSEYLAGKEPPPEHLACLASVIGGDPRSLMDEISETELQEALTALARIRSAQEQHRQTGPTAQPREPYCDDAPESAGPTAERPAAGAPPRPPPHAPGEPYLGELAGAAPAPDEAWPTSLRKRRPKRRRA